MRIKILRATFCPFFEEIDHFLQRFLFLHKKNSLADQRDCFLTLNFQFLCSGDCNSRILHDAKKPLDSSKRNNERKISSIVHHVIYHAENALRVVNVCKCCICCITCHIIPLSAFDLECVKKRTQCNKPFFCILSSITVYKENMSDKESG